MSRYILGPKTYGKLKGSLVCYRCGEALELGDEIVSKRCGRVPAKYYHKECYEAMFIEL